MEFFILKEHEVVSVGTLGEDTNNVIIWGEWSANTDRTVEKTMVGDVEVSTIFIGVDAGMGSRCLFETIAFGDVHNILEQDRYETWDEAVAGHRRVVRRMRSREKRKRPIQKEQKKEK